MLKDINSFGLLICHARQYQNCKKTGIIPGPYLMLMYVKKFLPAISEELQQTDEQDRHTDAHDLHQGPSPSEGDNY